MSPTETKNGQNDEGYLWELNQPSLRDWRAAALDPALN